MQQFKMTKERLDLSREDIAGILKDKPKNKNREDHVRKALENLNIPKEEIDKILGDLDSY
jgi:hypothetical protein